MAHATIAGMPACNVAIQRKRRTFLRNKCIEMMPSSSTANTMMLAGQAIASHRTGPTVSCKSIPTATKPQQMKLPNVNPHLFILLT